MGEKITEYQGWRVWCFDDTDWVAAKSFEEALAYDVEMTGHTPEHTREVADDDPCDLSTIHFRDGSGPGLGKCTFLESLTELLAGDENGHRVSPPRGPFGLSSTEF